MIAPCRSGTTALSRVVGYAGTTVVYQPIKEALRTLLMREVGPAMRSYFHVESTAQESLTLPAPREPRGALFVKETFGGGHPREASYNPLTVLLGAGWAPAQLVVIAMLREPLAVFASWLKCWGEVVGDEILARNFVDAHRTTVSIADQAEAIGIKVVRFEYDALGRHEPARVMERLFESTGLPAEQLGPALAGWEREPALLDGSDARFVMPRGRDHTRYLARVHEELLGSQGLRYVRAPSYELDALVGERLSARARAETERYYLETREACCEQLELAELTEPEAVWRLH